MNQFYKNIVNQIDEQNDIRENCLKIYRMFKKENIVDHICKIEKTVRFINKNIDENDMAIAILLHDISGIIDSKHYKEIAFEEKIKVCNEENKFPILLHQKISRDIAEKCFKITNENILSSIECHTTLKKNASLFDKVLFISDKIGWDEKDKPVFLLQIEEYLKLSIEKAVSSYIYYQINHRENMLIIHPWLYEASEDIK